MDWLTRIPWIGPWIARFMRTHVWRSYEHLTDVHWTRLAAAITFTSFVALFPLLTVGAAVAAALLTTGQVKDLQQRISAQVPGIADQLKISDLVANAGTVGIIGGALLLATGISWVSSLRDCLRAVWEKDDQPGNPILRVLADGGILLALGAIGLASAGCSAFATAAAGHVADHFGFASGGPGRVLLWVFGLCVAVLVDFVLLAYLLTRLPSVYPGRRSVVVAGFMGAVGFELLKLVISGYLQGVASKSMYGAFGVPVALLLWINLMAKLLLYCAAWTATETDDA